MSRQKYLDGMRGVACIIVVACHCLGLCYPGLKLILFNGQLSVSLFFVMSGFVLTSAFSRNDGFMQIPARCVRLGAPTIVSIAFAILLALIFNAHIVLGYMSEDRYSWLTDILLLNPPLWSIVYEIFGSVWVLFLVYFSRRSRAAYFFLLAASVPMFGMGNISLFTIGHLFATKRELFIGSKFNIPPLTCVAGVGFLFWLGAVSDPHSIAGIMDIGRIEGLPNLPIFSNVAAIGIFLAISSCVQAQEFLSSRALLHTGRLSFSIYLIHCPILFGIGNLIRIDLLKDGHFASALACFTATFILTWIGSEAFDRLIDAPSIKLSYVVRSTNLRSVDAPITLQVE